MLFLTRLFGVTASDAERDIGAERGYAEAIVEHTLLMQSNAAARQHRRLCRGTHAKGTCVGAEFEVLDVSAGRDPSLAARLARGIFAAPGVYPATIRFANADPHRNSDARADVRSLSVAVDLTRAGGSGRPVGAARQDFSLQNAPTLPLNDARAFLATMQVLTAPSPPKRLLSLPLQERMRVLRTLVLAQAQARQRLKPYQRTRFWSTVPFRHGPQDVVKYAATPSPGNQSRPLQLRNPDALQDELLRHVYSDTTMSSFEFGVQFLDPRAMTYWGKRQDVSFWIENASVAWRESQAPFHTVARLTLLPRSRLSTQAADALYFDVTGNATPDSAPVGSINRARCPAETASRLARRADPARQPD